MVRQAAEKGSAVPSKKPEPGATASEGAPPKPSADEAHANRTFWIQFTNLALLAASSLPIYILLDIHFGQWAKWTFGTAAGGLGLVGALKIATWFRNLKPLSPFFEDLINRLVKPLQRPRITPYFVGITAIVLPWSIIDWRLHNNFPVLVVLPGPDLTDLLVNTDVTPEKTYEILVKISRNNGTPEERRLSPRDASSIDIGESKDYLSWRARADSELSDQQMNRLLQKLGDDEIRGAWKADPQLLSTRRLEEGDSIQISFRCRGGKLPLFEPIEQVIIRDQPRRTPLLLEPKNPDNFFSKAAECETVP